MTDGRGYLPILRWLVRRRNLCLCLPLAASLGMASASIAAEKGFQIPKPFSAPKPFQSPKGFEIPRQEAIEPAPDPIPEPVVRQKLELLVPASAASPAASPIDASVVIAVNGKDSKGHSVQFFGSGTAILAHDGKSTILTCAHNFRGIANPSISITSQTHLYSARLMKSDDADDLALLEVNGELPCVDLSDAVPKVGDILTSIGSSSNKLEERTHKLTSLVGHGTRNQYETDGNQEPGRSGGGLFFNGNLVGVIQGRTIPQQKVATVSGHSHKCPNGRCGHVWARTAGGSHNCPKCGTYQSVVHQEHVSIPVASQHSHPTDSGTPIYVSIEPIRRLLVNQAYGETQLTEIELWMAPFKCHGCDVLNASVGNGNERVKVIGRYIAPKGWNPSGTYPFVRIKDADGTWHLLHGISNLAGIEKQISKLNAGKVEIHQYQPQAQPSGVTLAGSEIIGKVLDTLDSTFGDGAKFTLKIKRIGAKEALLINETHTKKDILGTSGTISIAIESAKEMPLKSISFGYRFAQGIDGPETLFAKMEGEVEIHIPQPNSVGETAKPVGVFPIMIAYEIISIGFDLYELVHPQISLFLPAEMTISAQIKDHVLMVDMGPNCMKIRANWAFMFGLVNVEYNRPLTGVILSTSQAILQMHKSRFIRDFTISVK